MKRIETIIGTILLFGLFSSCVDPVDLTEVSTERLLVVDALISDQNVRQQVTLSRSVPLNSASAFAAEKGATIWLEDESGSKINFEEDKNGNYLSQNPFAASFGQNYTLHIRTSDGKSYSSTSATMVPTPDFDSLYVEFEPHPSPTNRYAGIFSFYVDMHSNPGDHRYFRWLWNSTYELRMATPSRWLWTGGNTYIFRERGSESDSLQVEVCWNTDTAKVINIRKLLDGETQILKQPIHRFHSDSGYMKIRYSILAKQYAISEESYRFWNLIEESGGQGFLFDKQVGTIRGNIYNEDNRDEPVLGFFEVVQERSVRKFYEPREFTKKGYYQATPYIKDCTDQDPVITGVDEIGEFMEKYHLSYTLCYFITDPPSAAYYRKECADCTLYGDTNQKPDFW